MVGKLAAGISDNYAVGVLAESIGLGVPVMVVPLVNAALAARAPFRRAVAWLREDNVKVLFGEADDWMPHPPGSGQRRAGRFPWKRALDVLDEAVRATG